MKFGTATPYGLLALPQDLYMDIYEPANDTLSKRPIILFQFGGAFLIGTRNQPVIPAFCEYFAKLGYVVVTIDYRIGFNTLSTGSAERAVYRAVQDQRAAIRFLAQRATQYRIDTSSIFLTGTSAGCFAALHSTFMTQQQAPISYQGIPLEPDNLGCIECSGNNDNGNTSPRARGIINQWGAILDTNFITAVNAVPILSIHGTADNAVPYDYGYPFSYPVFPNVYGSLPITQQLNNVGGRGQLVPLVGFGHEPELLNPELNDTIYKYSRLFMYDIIRPHTSAISGPNTICRTKRTTYSVFNTAGSKYCWQFSGNYAVVSNNNSSVTIIWNDTGTHTISVKEINYLRAEGEVCEFQTNVIAEAVAGFTVSTNELDATFSNLSENSNNYFWSFGDGTFDSISSPSKSYSPGTYSIQLKADNGFCADSVVQSITLDSCPKAKFTFNINNRNGFFNASTTNSNNYNWNFGDGDSATVSVTNVFHQFTESGTYVITLRVTNALGCTSVFSDTVTVSIVNGIDRIKSNSLQIQANPTLNGIEVYTPENTLADVEIYNHAGQLIYSTQQVTNGYLIPFQNKATGIYYARIAAEGSTVSQKFYWEK